MSRLYRLLSLLLEWLYALYVRTSSDIRMLVCACMLGCRVILECLYVRTSSHIRMLVC